MARRRAHIPLNVFLNGRLVGAFRRQSSGAVDFLYDPSWLDWPHHFPISLSLPLREDRYIGAAVSNVFDNLLPDGDGLRRRLAERAGAEGTDVYSLLRALGRDCVGALQFLPEGVDPGPAGASAGKAVSDDEVAEIIRQLGAKPLGVDEDQDFRISLAGAQEKTALLRKDGQWLKPLGAAATTHILKPQIGHLSNGLDLSNSVENEFLCLKLIAGFGLKTANVELAEFGGRKTLIVERFDRLWTRDGRLLRQPQEDMCQALSVPPTRKYQSDGGPAMGDIIHLLKGADQPEVDIACFIKACILFWLLGATDGHAKNFSLFLKPGGGFALTPIYDVLSAQPSLDAGQIPLGKFKLAMSAGKNRHYRINDIMPRHFVETAELAGVSPAAPRRIFDELATQADAVMAAVAADLPKDFPEALILAVGAALKDRARRLAAGIG